MEKEERSTWKRAPRAPRLLRFKMILIKAAQLGFVPKMFHTWSYFHNPSPVWMRATRFNNNNSVALSTGERKRKLQTNTSRMIFTSSQHSNHPNATTLESAQSRDERGGGLGGVGRHKSESSLLAAACTLDHIFRIFRVNRQEQLHYSMTQNANESQHGVAWN